MTSGDDGHSWTLTLADGQTLLQTWCGRHPYYITLFGRRLWENPMDWEAALRQFKTDARSRLEEAWALLSKKQQQKLQGLIQQTGSGSDFLQEKGWQDGTQVFAEIARYWFGERD